MGNEMKNVARGFKFLWATFSKIMGNVFSRHGQCFLLLSVGCASCPWVVRWLRLLSVGYACYPWVAPIGFTHGCVLITALRFASGCIKMCVRILAGNDPQSHTHSI